MEGILIYATVDFPSTILKYDRHQGDINAIFIEISLRKAKCLVYGRYYPPSQNDDYYFYEFGKSIDSYS